MLTKRDLLRSAAAIAAGAAIARPSLLMAQGYPDIIEAKDIAEEGFIYGLPLVMNYAVMHEFAVDRSPASSRRRSTKIDNMHHVATYEDTAISHAEQRHAILHSVAGFARRADGDLRAGGGEGALLFGPVD